MNGTVSFFHALAPALTANILTAVLVYCFALIEKQERSGAEEGRLTYLWLIVMVFMDGLYTWGVYPLDNSKRSAASAVTYVKRSAASVRREQDRGRGVGIGSINLSDGQNVKRLVCNAPRHARRQGRRRIWWLAGATRRPTLTYSLTITWRATV